MGKALKEAQVEDFSEGHLSIGSRRWENTRSAPHPHCKKQWSTVQDLRRFVMALVIMLNITNGVGA